MCGGVWANSFNVFKAQVPVAWSPHPPLPPRGTSPWFGGFTALSSPSFTEPPLPGMLNQVKRLVAMEMYNARKKQLEEQKAPPPAIAVGSSPAQPLPAAAEYFGDELLKADKRHTTY